MKRILQRLFFWRAPDFFFSVRCSFGLHSYGPLFFDFGVHPIGVFHRCQNCPHIGRPSVEKVVTSARAINYDAVLDV